MACVTFKHHNLNMISVLFQQHYHFRENKWNDISVNNNELENEFSDKSFFYLKKSKYIIFRLFPESMIMNTT